MIYTDRTVTVSNNECKIDSPVVLYRGDKNITIRLQLINCSYSEATKGQLIIKAPNKIITMNQSVLKNNVLAVQITADMIDEVIEVGTYDFHIRLLDDNSAVTLPPVMEGIEVREPIAIENE